MTTDSPKGIETIETAQLLRDLGLIRWDLWLCELALSYEHLTSYDGSIDYQDQAKRARSVIDKMTAELRRRGEQVPAPGVGESTYAT